MSGFDMSIPGGSWIDSEYKARQWMTRFLETHRANGGLGIDSETTGLVRHRDRVLYWSLSDGRDRVCMEAKMIGLYKEPILENKDINFDFTNAPFDAHMFANTGADLSLGGEWRDTRVQSWLLNENNQGRHGLKDCINEYFRRVTPTFEQTFGKVPPTKRDKLTGRIISKTLQDMLVEAFSNPTTLEAASDYASLDAYNSTTLRAFFDRKLAEVSLGHMSLFQYFHAVEVPFTKVLWKMERRGITVDAGYLKSLQGPMEAEMTIIERDFAHEAGRLMKMNSVVDIRWFFYDHLGKPVNSYTDGGRTGNRQPATDAEVLEGWAGEGDPWAQKLLRYRGISKIFGTYVKGLQDWITPPFDYRIHTSLNQIGTVTGRLSSSEPNLQNIPRVSEDRFKIREAFLPGDNMVLVIADYAQLEMRLMAHFSRDQKMVEAIKNGTDLHCLTVSEMEGIPYDEVMAAVKADKAKKKAESSGMQFRDLLQRELDLLIKRQNNKETGFGIIYGIGGPRLAAGLTRNSGIYVSPEQGTRLINQWLNVFPGVRDYIEATKREINTKGRVQTLVGRFRRFGDLRGMSRGDAAQAERQGVNSIVQGSAADIAKTAMLRSEYDPELNSLGAHLLLQIHDELIFECPNDPEVIKSTKRRVQEIMEHPFSEDLLVPLPAEAGHGLSWASAK